MSRSELETNFKHLASSIDDIKSMIQEITSHQQSHYKKIIILEQNEKHMRKDMENHKKNGNTVSVRCFSLHNF